MNPGLRIRDGWREALWAFLGARVLLTVISVIGGGMLALPPGQPPTDAGFPNPDLMPGWHMAVTALQRQDEQALLLQLLAEVGLAVGDVDVLDDLAAGGSDPTAKFHGQSY